MRILLVEDEQGVAGFVKKGLEEERYNVELANDGRLGLELASQGKYDLLILDVMLPSLDGFSLCREVRKQGITTPVLMLTAKIQVKDKVTGLDAGADDYLTKPFSFEEFLARVRALLRRGADQKTPVLKLADLELNQLTHE